MRTALADGSLARRFEGEAVFKRFGLGYQYRPPEAPVVMTFDNVSERRGEVRAEVHVESVGGGHILRRYLNLLGSNSAKDLARDLAAVPGCDRYPWPRILESATESIIRAVRLGPDLETYAGEMDRPPPVRWLCDELVMAGVPNVWIAAASTGKSTFSVGLAVCHAAGAPFLGRQVTRGVPLYLDWESDGDDFREKAWLVSRWLGLRTVPPVHRLPMRGAASGNAAAIATRIDQLGATLVIWDGVQAAGGPVGQYATYESVAMDLEAVLGMLPPTTHLLLDHVTGDEMKTDAVPRKGRGGSRKVEWTRNQWTLILDREAHLSERHVVGWTHTKINRGRYLPSFGVEVLHREDELGFRVVGEEEVKPLHEKMPTWKQLLVVAQQAGKPLMNREAARLWKGDTDTKTVKLVGMTVDTNPKTFTRNADGSFEPHWSIRTWASGDGAVGAKGTAAGTVAPPPVALRGEDDWQDPRFDKDGALIEDEEWPDELLPF